MLCHEVSHHAFLPSVVRANGVVLDCGANRGVFGKYCRNALSARVYFIEPNPSLAATLPCGPGFETLTCALAAKDGALTLHRAAAGDTSTTGFLSHVHEIVDEFTAPARSLESLCAELGIQEIDLLKLDIEGAELEVLEQAPASLLARIRQITCEFHDFLDPGHVPRIQRILARLRMMHFHVLPMSAWTYGDVLCVNQSLVGLSGRRLLEMRIHKYVCGLRRMCLRAVTR